MGYSKGMTKSTPASRATARNLAKVNAIKARLAKLEAYGHGSELLAETLREQIAIRLVGRCRECHRLLTDPSSVADGIGPECATKVA